MYELDISSTFAKFEKQMREALSPQDLREVWTAAARAGGIKAESVVSDYPEASGKPLPVYYVRSRRDGTSYKSKFASAKQQGFVMMLAAKGLISYRRTGTLGRSITSHLVGDVTENSATVALGSNRDYAPYVIDRERQSHYHQGTWTPIQDDVENFLPSIADTVARVAGEELMKRLKF